MKALSAFSEQVWHAKRRLSELGRCEFVLRVSVSCWQGRPRPKGQSQAMVVANGGRPAATRNLPKVSDSTSVGPFFIASLQLGSATVAGPCWAITRRQAQGSLLRFLKPSFETLFSLFPHFPCPLFLIFSIVEKQNTPISSGG